MVGHLFGKVIPPYFILNIQFYHFHLFILGGKSMEDRTLVCQDCGMDFIFTAGEQEFYKEKGFDNEPKRCKECRDRKKRDRGQYRPE
jgi:hypothetical protein